MVSLFYILYQMLDETNAITAKCLLSIIYSNSKECTYFSNILNKIVCVLVEHLARLYVLVLPSSIISSFTARNAYIFNCFWSDHFIILTVNYILLFCFRKFNGIVLHRAFLKTPNKNKETRVLNAHKCQL